MAEGDGRDEEAEEESALQRQLHQLFLDEDWRRRRSSAAAALLLDGALDED